MENDADTVTPLDGDGSNVTGVTEQFDNVSVEDYSTRGHTTVATRRGYRFAPSNKDIPVVTHEGLNVTKEQASELVTESDGVVYITEEGE